MARVYKKTTSTTTMAAGRRKRVVASRPSKPMVVRGFTRTGGYYKRFTPRTQRFGELKFLDTALAATNITTVGTVNPNINVIAQGDGQSQRIGRKVVIKSIHFKGRLIKTNSSDPTFTFTTTRLILVQDKQANGQAFAVTDYLTSADYLSHKNLSNSNRFVCLLDQTFTMNNQAGAWDGSADQFGNVGKKWEKYIRCNIPIEYDTQASTGAIATQRSNSIALIMINDVNNASTLQYNCRIRYSD